MISLTVMDTGIGMDATFLRDGLLVPFVQAECVSSPPFPLLSTTAYLSTLAVLSLKVPDSVSPSSTPSSADFAVVST